MNGIGESTSKVSLILACRKKERKRQPRHEFNSQDLVCIGLHIVQRHQPQPSCLYIEGILKALNL